MRFDQVLRVLKDSGMEGAHLKPVAREFTPDAAVKYCSKLLTRVEGYEPQEFGPIHTCQGKRTDLEGMVGMIKDGSNTRQLFEAAPDVFLKYASGINKAQLLYRKKRDQAQPPRVYLFYGPPGCGKTSKAVEIFDNDYWIPMVSKDAWFDGYNGQNHVLFDDYHGHIRLDHLLQLLDRYDVTVPIKGGSVVFNPEKIIFATNNHPAIWYNYQGRRDLYPALMRRFSNVLYWSDRQKLYEFVNPGGQADPERSDPFSVFWRGPDVDVDPLSRHPRINPNAYGNQAKPYGFMEDCPDWDTLPSRAYSYSRALPAVSILEEEGEDVLDAEIISQ